MRSEPDVSKPEALEASTLRLSKAELKRTSNRKSSSGGLVFKLLRLSLAGLLVLAPTTTVKLVAGLFRTPLPTKLSHRKSKLPAGVRLERLAFENATLTLYFYPAAEQAPQILLTHGWAGYGMQMAELADVLSQQGWAVVVIDQPGHGRSAGWTSNLQQFSRALSLVGTRLHRLEAIIGHSMGAAAATHAVVNGLAIKKLALLAAPVSLTQETRSMALSLGLSEATLQATIALIEAREAVPFATVEASYLAPKIKAPTLVIHDLEDRVVPYSAAQTLIAYLPAPSLYTTTGLGHRRLLKEPEVIQQISQFLGSPSPASQI